MFKIIIIGAGASGLAAASRLSEHGIHPAQITILEAENRIGGRIHTINQGSGTIEMGAQWVHGQKDNPVFALASDAGELLIDLETPISMNKEENFLTAYPQNGQILSSVQMDEFRLVTNDIYESSKIELAGWKKSLGEFYLEKFQKLIKGGLLKTVDQETAQDLVDLMHREIILEIACDNWKEACGNGCLEYRECEGNYYNEWKRGYSVLFDLLMRNIPKANNGQQLPLSDRIHLNSQVVSIHWDSPDNKVKVNCKDNTFEADIVLVTCSLGVLKEKADQLFYPHLPQKKREAIEGLGYGTVNKIYLEFRQKWWNDGWGGVNFLTHSAHRSGAWFEAILGFYTVHNQPNLLEGWVTGSAARIVETLPESELLEKCCSLLQGSVGSSFDYEEPIGLIRSQWHSNPNFRGSYSFRSLESKKRNVWASDLAEPVIDSKGIAKLFFAGEASHSHRYSNVHGAVETGWREADRIIQLIPKS